MTTKIDLTNIADTALTTLTGPKVTTIVYPGTETATDTAGGETINLTGNGFQSGCSVLVGSTAASVVTYISATQISFTAPAMSANTYVIYVINPDGGTAISIPGISYSGTPNWTTSAGSLGSAYETDSVSATVTATGDAPITYTLASGTLPTGSTLSSSGSLSGTAPSASGSTQYSFTITAKDAQNQTTNRAFTLTINPDVVTWSTPADNSTTTAYEYTAISNVAMSASSAAGKSITYSANSLPTGLSISGANITGTPTVVGSTSTLLTGTSATTNKTATKTVNFVVNQDVVTWSSPADNTTTTSYTNSAIANITMSASSAAGQSITYTANALPTGLSISGANITGTPTVAASSSSLITATASTTNRTATRTFNWVISVANDTYFKNTTLLLNGETTVTPFIGDASTNSFGLTINGDTKPTLFNPYTPGYYSNFFNTASSESSLTTANTSVNLGSGDFTVEGWFTASALADGRAGFVIGTTGTVSLYLISSGTTNWQIGTYQSPTWSLTASMTTYPAIAAWSHIAIVRLSNNIYWYINGIQVGTVANSTTYTGTGASVGYWAATGGWLGYISNFRIVVGTAVYTTTFTPPTGPLTAIANTRLLTCQSNGFVDKSTNALTLTLAGSPAISPNIPFTANSSYSTYGSAYFDGTGDYLTLTGSSIGSSNYTVEAWICPTSLTAFSIFSLGTSDATGNMVFYVGSDGSINLYADNASRLLSSAGLIKANQWQHVALVRNGTTSTIYVNGVSAASSTNTYTSTSTAYQICAGYGGLNTPITGYISNLRVVNGTAVYTTAFTPPTSPLAAIANTSLLTLQYNGGANNSGIIDNSNFNNIITRNGNATQGTFSPYSVTGWSNYFDGAGDYLTPPMLNFGTTDFTVEAWVYPSVSGGVTPPDNQILYISTGATTRLAFRLNSVNKMDLYLNAVTPGVTVYTSNTILSINTWYHLAAVRQSGSIKLFVNGILDNTPTASVHDISDNITYSYIGSIGASTQPFNGYISNFRITSTAVYTATFTPSTTPLTAISGTRLLTCQSNRFIDNSTNAYSITKTGDVSVQAFGPFGSISEATPISYSNYFDGTGDYLYSSASSANAMGTGDYTVEAWIYATYAFGTSGQGRAAIISNRGGTSAPNAFMLQHYNGKIYFGTASVDVIVGSTTMVTNTWYHVAVSRSSGTVRLFLNGVSDATAVTGDSTNHSDTNAMYIGLDGAYASYPFTGYISNARLVKGTAVYTSAFTPPTTPLTAISGTSLLTCQSTRMIDNSTNNFTLTANGDVKPRIFNPFGYTTQTYTSYTPSLHGGSIYCLNTSSYVTTNMGALQAFGTGDFTVECWVYNTATAHNLIMAATSTTSWSLLTYGSQLYWQENGGNLGGAGYGTIVLNTWSHFAITRTSGTLRMFINGIQVYSVANTYDYSNNSTNRIIGPNAGGTAGQYISDVRVTKGTAIYTSNFVPPTQTLTNYSTTYPASLLLNFTNGGIVDQHSSFVFESVGNTQLSTSVKKYNNASMYFDGTGDYCVSTPINQLYAFGTGDLTIEAWIYRTDTGVQRGIVDTRDNSSVGILFFITSNNKLNLFDGTSVWLSSTNTVAANQWVHVAASRASGTTKLFINGAQEASGADTRAYTAGSAGLYIARQYGSTTNDFMGYIDDLRITKGYARYTSAFTAPTSALITK